MWRGIKKIISWNNSNHIFSTAITVDKKTITKPSDIGNAFNNYFAKVAIDIQSSIRFTNKSTMNTSTPKYRIILYNSNESAKVSNIISSLNQGKNDEPNKILIRILKLLNKDISDWLAILLNQSFSCGIFPFNFENQWNYSNVQKRF